MEGFQGGCECDSGGSLSNRYSPRQGGAGWGACYTGSLSPRRRQWTQVFRKRGGIASGSMSRPQCLQTLARRLTSSAQYGQALGWFFHSSNSLPGPRSLGEALWVDVFFHSSSVLCCDWVGLLSLGMCEGGRCLRKSVTPTEASRANGPNRKPRKNQATPLLPLELATTAAKTPQMIQIMKSNILPSGFDIYRRIQRALCCRNPPVQDCRVVALNMSGVVQVRAAC